MTQINQPPYVTDLTLKKKSCELRVSFSTGRSYTLSCEMLRVYSPSAEVQGHGKPILVTHKKNINITAIEPLGNYAVKITFDDGHDTGLFSWEYLYKLSTQQALLWQAYLTRLETAKASREPLIDLVVKYHK
ncbi:gamma-butyrobetaine hydroxylase-like domain-containing protein [Shewanella surugensis]|uniref:DUF971 domain-containing protein n=1 Tax=Shewanella surugensis TaxID=212020 RepID=A0ABT0LEJ9_9GAMM|nr:DUF971 domain-containing protein [Shewanella surugensis]MCL1126127.1 DUF971 domain-containing protein [Shewanella surugensis]